MTDPIPTPPKDRRVDYKVWAATGVAALWAAVEVVVAFTQASPDAVAALPTWLRVLVPFLVFAAGYWKKSQRTGS